MAGDQTHRQLRIVGEDRPDANEDGVVRGAKLVREAERSIAAHIPRIAGARRDASVDRLCVVHRHERTADRHRRLLDAARIRQVVEQVAHARSLRAQVRSVDLVGNRLKRNALDHVDAVHLEPEDLRRVVRHEAHRADPELLKDRRRGRVIAGVDRQAKLDVGVDRVEATVLEAIRADLVEEPDPPPLMVEIKEDPAVGGADHGEGRA